MVMLLGVIAVLLIALLGWWDDLFSLEQHRSIHVDAGFYLVTSVILFLFWFSSIFVVDRFPSVNSVRARSSCTIW